jgi:hypothetical protein
MTDSSWLNGIGIEFAMKNSDYKRNKFVLVSSLLFLIPAIAFAVNGDYITAISIAISCFFSVLGDYVYVGTQHTDAYKHYDRLAAALLFGILITRRFVVRGEPEAIFLSKIILPLSMFKYSSMATTQNEWVIRHSLWHISLVIIFLSEV